MNGVTTRTKSEDAKKAAGYDRKDWSLFLVRPYQRLVHFSADDLNLEHGTP
jgi:hypothetical protein